MEKWTLRLEADEVLLFIIEVSSPAVLAGTRGPISLNM
jgi:hypothetical protein